MLILGSEKVKTKCITCKKNFLSLKIIGFSQICKSCVKKFYKNRERMALNSIFEDTMKITGKTPIEIRRLLKDFTHTEIRTNKNFSDIRKDKEFIKL